LTAKKKTLRGPRLGSSPRHPSQGWEQLTSGFRKRIKALSLFRGGIEKRKMWRVEERRIEKSPMSRKIKTEKSLW